MITISALLLQDNPAGAALGKGLLAMGGTMMLVFLAIAIVFIIGMWKVFEKAGQPLRDCPAGAAPKW